MSLLPGVYTAFKKDGTTYYRSSITFQNKHISLGSFISQELANKAYLQAQDCINNKKITIEQFSSISVLSFHKWVVLINFRDNGIYIKNPIYLKKNYFLYYYDWETIFKFDIDDLFFYSKHKIIKRGGYLCVADFGMQINILSRYGIQNYSVKDRDYRFVNGDSSDYRYGNIEIINKYHGVQKKLELGKNVYYAKIHINGDYIIGKYKNEIDAAIAYNKAAAMLRAKGLKKDFNTNYINELDDSEYKDLYNKISISRKIKNL